jgi:prophage maintenance system killer protein
MISFLELNGVHITATNEEVVALGLSVAAGQKKYDDVLAWIKEHESP